MPPSHGAERGDCHAACEYKAQKTVRELAYGADHPKAVMDTPQSVEAVSKRGFPKVA